MTSVDLGNKEMVAPAMTEEDIFNSQPAAGSISYRIPSITKLFNLPEENFDHYQTMTFYVSVIAAAEPFPLHLKCGNLSKCKLLYRRAYTPTIYYLSPRVTYSEAYTEVFFNPANTLTLI